MCAYDPPDALRPLAPSAINDSFRALTTADSGKFVLTSFMVSIMALTTHALLQSYHRSLLAKCQAQEEAERFKKSLEG